MSDRARRRIILLLGVILLCSAIARADAQPQASAVRPLVVQEGSTRGTVIVHVVGVLQDQADPIPNVVVGVSDREGTAWKPTTTTDVQGRYQFRVRLRPGQYRLVLALAGLTVAESELFAVEASRGELEIEPWLELSLPRADSLPAPAPKERLLPRPEPFVPPPPPPPPPPLMLGAAPRGEARVVDVFYGTNRLPSDTIRYDARRANPEGLQLGIASVNIPGNHTPGELERPEIWRFEVVADPQKHFTIVKSQRFATPAEFYQRARNALEASDSEAFLFVHGYNVTFDDAVLRTAQLFNDLEFTGTPFLFSWPAQDAWWRYLSAEDQAAAAVPALQEFIRGLALAGKPRAINVIAHSMGNRVMVNALNGLMQDPELRRTGLFKNLVLAAPDVSLDNFSAVANSLKAAAARVTVYSSSEDVPLQLSRKLHQFARLGQAPPQGVPPGIDAVDASAVTTDMLGHSYFSYSASMLHDMILLLKNNIAPGARSLKPFPATGEVRYWVVPK